MTPYFEAHGITLYCGDARTILSSIGGYVACITDPPYAQTSLAWDRWVQAWPGLLEADCRVLWSFGSLRMFMDHASDFSAAGFRLAQDLVWEKHNGSSCAADRFRRVHEQAAHFYRGAWADQYNQVPRTLDATHRVVRRKQRPAHWNAIAGQVYESSDGGPRIARSVQRLRSEHGRADNETQKPVALARLMIEASVPLGGVLLDPFMGSGSILVAAKQLGRQAIGIDIRESQCAATARRLSQELPLVGMV